MTTSIRRPSAIALLALLAAPAWCAASAQPVPAENSIDVYGIPPADLSGLEEGPKIEGVIAARREDAMRVAGMDGSGTTIRLSEGTEIKGSGGFLGLSRDRKAADALLNGLPVTVETVRWNGGLVASRIRFKNDDLQTATMIRNGTAQRFAEHGAAIEKNRAAADALRSRMADIDQYNVKSTSSVYFNSGKWNLSPAAQAELCMAADQARAMNNALLLVVGYTDSVGSQEYNQVLSERRAGRVVNHLQQACGWPPYRMLTPTGMAEADPAADNSTSAGKAQNRRVSVNILVSKALDGF